MIYRIYSSKKAPFAVEEASMLNDLKGALGLEGLKSVKIYNRYDVEGLAPEDAGKVVNVFSEPQVDEHFDVLPETDERVFAIEFLPGQYDQRADSCAQCIECVLKQERPLVASAKVIVLEGNISDDEFAKIKKYLINPVECREASLEKPETLKIKSGEPKMPEVLTGFNELSEEGLQEFLNEKSLAMDLDDLKFCQKYFRDTEKRDPVITEIKIIDTYWSDHCRHTTFNTHLKDIEIEDKDVKEAYDRYIAMRDEIGSKKPVTLMDMACIGGKYLSKKGIMTSLDKSEEINACSVNIKATSDGKVEDWLLMFKNETHNHPTEIEPFGGAATCLGGAIRDPLSGRAFVHQAMRVTACGNILAPVEATREGRLPQSKIAKVASQGYSSYGNQIGLTTGHVDEIYHDGYVAKHMECGAVVGAALKENVVRNVPAPGDVVVLLGGRTGRDGIDGATGSSKAHDVHSLSDCGAQVQKGNAIEERKIQRLFRNGDVTKLIKRCNDFGAGGVSVAIGELADSLLINLDVVPVKYDGLTATEIAISESQERMAVVVAEKDVPAFRKYAEGENLETTVVAKVTDDGRMKMMYKGQAVADLSREFLNTNGTDKEMKVVIGKQEKEAEKAVNDVRSEVKAVLSDLNVCSKQGMVDKFDHNVGARTLLMPFGGKYQRTPSQAMAALLPTYGKTEDCTVMAYGYDPYMSEKSPFFGAYYAVVSSVAKMAANGGNVREAWSSYQEFFPKLGSDPKMWGLPMAALLGSVRAQDDLKIGSIGGKDSMSGSFEDIHVPPTLVSFTISKSTSDKVVAGEFKKAGNKLFLIEAPKKENGLLDGDAYLAILDKLYADIGNKVVSAYALGFGGLCEAIAKMSFGNRVGAVVENVTKEEFFRKNYGAIVVEAEGDISYGKLIGSTVASETIKVLGEEFTISELEDVWGGKLLPVYGMESNQGKAKVEAFSSSKKFEGPFVNLGAAPKALIPTFPGTNSEYDTYNALKDAGADPEIFLVRNLTSSMLEESLDELAKKVKESHIIVIPGGFSGGDEPDGSGKFITAVFKGGKVREEIDRFTEEDKLMLGICNGFQALVKLGLVPYGKVTEVTENSPTLTFNSISRHQAKLVDVRLATNASPWLMGDNVGDIYTVPISHGEGRFVAPENVLKELIANGQVAGQYVDKNGVPTMDVRYNPSGSMYAIESIISPNGKIMGKMGHNERLGKSLYKNGEKLGDMKLFRNAVKYFKG